MYCDRCGTKMEDNQPFCQVCGRAGAVPLMPARSRIAGHLRLLGILWLAISAFRIIPGFFLMVFFRPGYFEMDMPLAIHHLLQFVGLLFIGGAVLGIIAGWGLLERQPWARMLAIVLGCFNLIDMPFGTALGIYTLWALLPAKSEEEYRQISRVA